MSCIHPANAQYMDRARGTMTCALCGEVVADQQLELDPAFARGDRPAGGGANRAHQAGFARPNRTTVLQAPVAHRPSIENARRSIAAYARQLEVSSDFVDMAVALFKLAVNNNSIAGSRPSVLCACLYAICRKENTPHMLFDFAEASKESPFSILSNLKLICKSTNTTLPPPDPSFYVPRMVHELFKKLIRVVFGSDIDGHKELDHTRGPEVIVNFEVGKLLDRSRLLPIFEGAALYEVYCPESDSSTINYADEKRNLQAISADTLEEYRNAKIERDELLDNITILALKILHTMGQEWIGYGRRPVGLSAAAVLVACRNFGVEIALVALVGIAQLSPETIMMRVDEWTKTSAGTLHNIDDYRGASNTGLPPCYTRGLNPARIEKESRAIEKSAFFDMYFVICASVRANTPVNEHTARQWREFLLLAGKLKDLSVDEESLDLYALSHDRQLEILGITDAAPTATANVGGGEYEGDAFRKSRSSDPMTAVIEELTQAHTGELAFRLAVSSFRGVYQQESTPGAAAIAASAAAATKTNQQQQINNTGSYLASGMGTPTGSGFDFPTMPLSPFPNNNNGGGGGMFPSVSSPDRFGGGGGPAADEFEFDADPSTTAGGDNHISSTSRAGSAAANMFLRKLGEQVKDVQALVNTDPRVSYAFKKAELTEEEQADADALVDAAREVLQQANVEVLRLPEYESDTFNPFDYKNTDRAVPSFRKALRANSVTSSVGIAIGMRRSRSVDSDNYSVPTDGTSINDEESRMEKSRVKSEAASTAKLGLIRSRKSTGQTDTTEGGGEPGPKKEEWMDARGSCPAYIDPRTYRAKDLSQYIISDLEVRLRKDAMMCKVLGDRWSKAGAAKSMLTVKTLEFRACVSDFDLSDPSLFQRNEPPQIPNLKIAAAAAGNPNSQWGSQMVEVDDDDFGDLGRTDYTQTQNSEAEDGEASSSSKPAMSHEERVRRKKIELTKNLIHFSSDSSATYLALSKQDPQQFPTPHEFNKRSRPAPSLMVTTSNNASTMPPGAKTSDAIGSMTSQILAEDPNDLMKFQRTSLATIARKQVRKSKIGFIAGHGSAQESLRHALKSRGGAQIDVTAVFGDADDDPDDIEVDGDGDFGGGGGEGAEDDWM